MRDKITIHNHTATQAEETPANAGSAAITHHLPWTNNQA